MVDQSGALDELLEEALTLAAAVAAEQVAATSRAFAAVARAGQATRAALHAAALVGTLGLRGLALPRDHGLTLAEEVGEGHRVVVLLTRFCVTRCGCRRT